MIWELNHATAERIRKEYGSLWNYENMFKQKYGFDVVLVFERG